MPTQVTEGSIGSISSCFNKFASIP